MVEGIEEKEEEGEEEEIKKTYQRWWQQIIHDQYESKSADQKADMNIRQTSIGKTIQICWYKTS